MGATKLMTAAGGGITLDAASTATDKTITLPADTGTMALTSQLNGFRNRIINGDMRIDQRNAGASVTNGAGYLFSVDRWITYGSQASKFSVQQVNSPVAGFSKAMKFTSLSSYSVASSDLFFTVHWIEGLNVHDLGWGTANAQAVTISFKVYSSLTGTFGGVVKNGASNRSYPFTFTVNTANTEEVKTITISGDTAGTWATDNGKGIGLLFGLGVGSTYSGAAGAWASADYYSATGATSVVGTNGATFYITGVQLEKGTVATGFDYRPYGTELALCQRYYYKQKSTGSGKIFGSGFIFNGSIAAIYTTFPTPMRTQPTSLEQSGTAGDYEVAKTVSNSTCTSVPAFSSADIWFAISDFTSSGLTGGQGCLGRAANSTAYLAWSAEL